MRASHIIGGDVTYELIGYNEDSTKVEYAIEFIIYRDTAGIDFDFFADFGIFQQVPGEDWTSYQVLNDLPIGQISEINALDDPCKEQSLSNLVIESGVYNFSVILDVGNFNYMIAYQKCCRNWTINNILNPGESGAVYDILITPSAQELGNNSPVFKEFPPTFVCQGFDFDFDHSAIDEEGDELRYSFCTPFLSGVNEMFPPPICCDCINPDPSICLPPFDRITYVAPFNEQNPVGGSPQITIDSITGMISGVPNLLGSYVVGVCVEEFRNGALIGSYRRDFEFNVEVCTPSVIADLQSDSSYLETSNDRDRKIHVFESCDSSFQLINLSTDIENIVHYKWVFSDSDGIIDAIEGPHLRDLEYTFSGPGIYEGLMVINDLKKCVDTAFMNFVIPPIGTLNFDFDHDPCTIGPVQFYNLSVLPEGEPIEWTWYVDRMKQSEEFEFTYLPSETGTFEIILQAVDEQGCEISESRKIDYFLNEEVPIQRYRCEKICLQDSVEWNDTIITTPGIFERIIPSRFGCDSIIEILETNVLPLPVKIANDTLICNGESVFFHNLEIMESGLYSYSFPYNNHPCDSVIHELNVEVSELPIFIESFENLCHGDSILFADRWIKDAGTYHEILSSKSTLCDSFEHVLVLDVSPPSERYMSDTILCPGDSINFENAWYREAGLYSAEYADQNGCDSIYTDLFLQYYDPLIVSFKCQDTVPAYVPTELSLEVNRSDFLISWIPSDGLSCDNCPNPVLTLSEDQSYQVTVVDENGCLWSKEISIVVDNSLNCYLPNIISKHPINNKVNERFFLQCNNQFDLHYNMFIYDRWGSEVGKAEGILANDPHMGWDIQDFLPGVYVYHIEIVQAIEPKVLFGDVTVVR